MQTEIENTQLNQDNLQSNPLTQEEPKGIENTQLHNAETTQSDALAQPVPAQKQLPADTYLYANTSNLGGVIQSTAKEYDIDPHKLEALMYNIQSGQAKLSGYYAMSVSAYPGMSAEAYTRALGKAIDLANTVSEDERIQALQRGEEYTSNGIDAVIDSMVSNVEGKTSRDLFQARLAQLQQADNIKFDTTPLAQYYETLVKGGTDKGTAWLRTMALQDEYRKSQGYKAVKQDLDALVTPAEMQRYTNDLYTRLYNTTDAEEKLRLYDQWEAATKLTKTYSEAYYNDPATYLQTKDPAVQVILMDAQETGNFADVVKAIDERYDEYEVPYSQRKYLRKDQAETLAKEITTHLYSDPIKAQAVMTNLTQTYGSNIGKVLNQLIVDEKLPVEAKILVETARIGNASINESVISMLKYKGAFGTKFAMEMLGTPDTNTAKIMRTKLEETIQKLPGVETLAQQFSMIGDIRGYEDMIQFYGDMALYYKFKNPRKSDREIVKMIEEDFISSIYTQDASKRANLHQRTLDGKPILYNGYDSKQAVDYLCNMNFTNQNLQVGGHDIKKSNDLLRDKNKIKFITLNQFEVQPVYDDGNGTVLALFKGSGDNRKEYKINLKHLGDEDILGVFDAREKARRLYSVLNKATAMSSMLRAAEAGYAMDKNTQNAYKALQTLGFQIDKFDTTKPFAQQFERTGMSERRVQAMTTLLKKQTEFDAELLKYENMKKTQRNRARPRLIAMQLIGPFLHTTFLESKADTIQERLVRQMIGPAVYPAFTNKNNTETSYGKHLSKYLQEKDELLPALKEQRIKLQNIEKEIMKEACIYLNYKGKLPRNPLTQELHEHNLIDKALWGGYGY